jgi:hypothetical protein
MWALRSGGTETVHELFGEHAWLIDALFGERYQVEVLTFRHDTPNKYRLFKLEHNPAAYLTSKVLVGEFDTPKELVAIAKLILASETN